MRDTESPATSGAGPARLLASPRLCPGRRASPTLRAVLVVLHVRRRRVRRRGAGRRSGARAGTAAPAQFRQSPVGGREFGSQVGHLLAGGLDRPIDAERELLIVFHHAQDFGLGAREVTKSCMMRGGGPVAGHPQLYLLGPPRPGSPAPRPPGTGSAGSSGVGMTAAPPAGAAAVARRSGEEEEEKRRRGRRSSDRRDPGAESARGGHRAPPGTLSMEPTIRRALGRGPGRGPGARSVSRAPHFGDTPPGGQGRQAAALSGPRGRPRPGVGGACSKAGPRSPPWSGGAAPALAN